MSNNKQSSVEWLSNHTYELFEQYSEGNFDRITLNKLMMKATEQAKAMHKEEIERAHYEGSVIVISKPDDDMLRLSQQYYNETFGE